MRDVRAALQLFAGRRALRRPDCPPRQHGRSFTGARPSGRMRELATRSAIGAGRQADRLRTRRARASAADGDRRSAGPARRLLESSARSKESAAVGAELPRAHEIRMDNTVFAFTVGLAVLLGFVIGAAPAVPTRARQPERRAPRGRPARGWRRHGTRPAPGSSCRRLRWRSCCSWARGCCSRASSSCFASIPRVRRGGRADRTREPSRHALS